MDTRFDRAPQRGLLLALTLAVAAFATPLATAQEVVQGMLELRWGDPKGGPGEPVRPARFVATLVRDDGQRIPLEPNRAKRAAGNLFALANRRIAVEFAVQQKSSGLRQAEVIVPADRLSLVPQKRGRLMESGQVMAAAPVSGNTRWITLACKFSDVPTEQKTIAFFQSQYGTSLGLLGHYWSEVSYGKVSLANSSAHGWYTLPQPRSFYITGTGDDEEANLSQLFTDCTAAADAEVSFANATGINMMFNGNLDGSAWGGGRCGTLDGVNSCKRVTWNPPWAFSNLAPLAHEMGHGYGLPHSDNSDGDDDTYDNPWDVMSDAWRNANRTPALGTLPKHINMVQRDRLAWVDAARILTIPADRQGRVQIALDFANLANSTNTQMVLIQLPDQPEPFRDMFYVLEARKAIGIYEFNLAGTAVIIHSTPNVFDDGNAKSIDTDIPPADVANNEGSMFKVGETWVTPDPLRSHWVTVESETPTGFIVSVGPKPHFTGGPGKPRVAVAPGVAGQPARAVAPAPAAVKARDARLEGGERRPQRRQR